MRRTACRLHQLRLRLGAAFGFVATGCSTPHSLQLATTVGAQHTEVAVESAVQRLPRAIGSGQVGAALDPDYWPYDTMPTLDLAIRRGLDDRSDLAMRFGSSGVELGYKRVLYSNGGLFHLGAEASAGILGRFTVRGTAQLIGELRPHPRWHLVASPKVMGHFVSTLGGDGNIHLGKQPLLYSLILDGGVAYDVTEYFRIMIEGAWAWPPAFVGDYSQQRSQFSGAASLQFHFADGA